MTRLVPIALALAVLGYAGAAAAQPIMISDDDNYARLARWEQRLDDRINDGMNRGSIRPRDGWRYQKRLDSIEMHMLQDYYQGNDGLTDRDARNYANQLRDLSRDLGFNDWRGFDSGGPGYGAPPPPPPPPSGGGYYHEGDYEQGCHSGNRAAGTIFGAIAGGLIGGAVSHGNGGAVVGGVILGGIAGNALAGDIDCDDQHYAFARYNDALDGPVGTEVRWEHNGRYGTFRTIREYRDGPYVCRDFHAVSYRNGQRFERDGSACRQSDGYWHFR